MAHRERSGGISLSPTPTSFQRTRTILDGQRVAQSLCPGGSQTQSSLGTTVDDIQTVAVSSPSSTVAKTTPLIINVLQRRQNLLALHFRFFHSIHSFSRRVGGRATPAA